MKKRVMSLTMVQGELGFPFHWIASSCKSKSAFENTELERCYLIQVAGCATFEYNRFVLFFPTHRVTSKLLIEPL